MLFALIFHDRAGHLETRMAARPDHLAYLETHAASLVHAGAMLDGDGKPLGSLMIVDMEDRAAAEAFAAGDPYAKAGLFETSAIHPFRGAFKDGAKLV